MENPNCEVYLEFDRPDNEDIDFFRNIPVSNIGDAMNRLGLFDYKIKPINNNIPFSGPALTIKLRPSDNLMVYKALDLIKPGDVLIIDAGGFLNQAIIGEIIVKAAMIKGAAAIVIDGSIRDYDVLSSIEFPVYAKGISPSGPYKDGPGSINTKVSCCGVVVEPGDLIIGDADGIAAVPLPKINTIKRKVTDVIEKEEKIIKDINNYLIDNKWIEQKLNSIGCIFHEKYNR